MKFSDEEPLLSDVVMHTKTVILLENFSFDLNNCVYLSSTFFIQHFLTFFLLFSLKTAFSTFFILGVNVFYIYDFQRHDYSQQVANRALHKVFRKNTEKSYVLCFSYSQWRVLMG